MSGFVKILVSDDEDQKILGMRGAGPQISSTVVSIAHFMDQGNGAGEVLKLLYPHPTISESIQECLRLLLGKSLYKPLVFPGRIKIRRWRPDTGYADL
jgi:dihydrolipoamide dehydrogenase